MLKVFVCFLALAMGSLVIPGSAAPREPVTETTPEKRGSEVEFIKLSAPSGTPILINRGEIIAFHRSTDDHKLARTQVRVHDGSFWVRETTDVVAEILGDLSAFVKLTTPEDAPIWITRAEIIAFHAPVQGLTVRSAKTQIKVHEGSYFLRETVEEVASKLIP